MVKLETQLTSSLERRRRFNWKIDKKGVKIPMEWVSCVVSFS